MNKSNKYILYLLALLCVAGWEACSQDRQPCLTPKISSLNIRCVRRASLIDTTAVDTALPSAVLLPLTTTGALGTLYPQQSTFTISLSSAADSCRWAFSADTSSGGNYDTLTFYYERKLQFVSNACGYADFYTLHKVNTTRKFIDSLRVTNTNVTNNVNTSHLQVFIHPNY